MHGSEAAGSPTQISPCLAVAVAGPRGVSAGREPVVETRRTSGYRGRARSVVAPVVHAKPVMSASTSASGSLFRDPADRDKKAELPIRASATRPNGTYVLVFIYRTDRALGTRCAVISRRRHVQSTGGSLIALEITPLSQALSSP